MQKVNIQFRDIDSVVHLSILSIGLTGNLILAEVIGL